MHSFLCSIKLCRIFNLSVKINHDVKFLVLKIYILIILEKKKENNAFNSFQQITDHFFNGIYSFGKCLLKSGFLQMEKI